MKKEDWINSNDALPCIGEVVLVSVDDEIYEVSALKDSGNGVYWQHDEYESSIVNTFWIKIVHPK